MMINELQSYSFYITLCIFILIVDICLPLWSGDKNLSSRIFCQLFIFLIYVLGVNDFHFDGIERDNALLPSISVDVIFFITYFVSLVNTVLTCILLNYLKACYVVIHDVMRHFNVCLLVSATILLIPFSSSVVWHSGF